jgi:hypothetical protein
VGGHSEVEHDRLVIHILALKNKPTFNIHLFWATGPNEFPPRFYRETYGCLKATDNAEDVAWNRTPDRASKRAHKHEVLSHVPFPSLQAWVVMKP